jgi:hypothetical protein
LRLKTSAGGLRLIKADVAYPTVLARYGIAQFRAGRRVGASQNINDILSRYCQHRKGVLVERLDRYDRAEDAWCETCVEERHAGPADVAATKLDFSEWLRSLPRRPRWIAKTLATGETTGATAKRFGVSQGRVSQLRRDLAESWRSFVGEQPTCDAAVAVA